MIEVRCDDHRSEAQFMIEKQNYVLALSLGQKHLLQWVAHKEVTFALHLQIPGPANLHHNT